MRKLKMEKKFNKNVAKVYTIITGGLYPDPDTDATWVLDEFKELYEEPANLARDLRDKMDEIFDECDTVEDCKEALESYFYDIWA